MEFAHISEGWPSKLARRSNNGPLLGSKNALNSHSTTTGARGARAGAADTEVMLTLAMALPTHYRFSVGSDVVRPCIFVHESERNVTLEFMVG